VIPHSRPRFGTVFKEAVERVLGSGHVAMGSEALALEQEAGLRLQQPHAVALDSGTSALMLAVRALKEDRQEFNVGIPAYTCSSVLHAVQAAGATPVCMDCRDDLCLDPDNAFNLANMLDAIILVHPFGYVEAMAAESWPCPTVEDIAQSAGGCLQGRELGSFGDIAIASFYATKPWGGAYGGMLLSRQKKISERVRVMRNADAANLSQGYAGNHQLSDLHAVLARTHIQLSGQEQLKRKEITALFDGWLTEKDARPVAHANEGNSYRYIVRIEGGAEKAIAALRNKGMYACRPVEVPISVLLGDNSCPGAGKAWRECVSLPLLADMTGEELNNIKKAISACLK